MNTKKLLLSAILSALLGVLLLSGCNTVQGAGKDIEKAGDKLQGAAERNK